MAELFKIEDPRDSLAKCSRDDLWDYARVKGADIYFPHGADTPRDDMILILRNKGCTDIEYIPTVMGRPIKPSPYRELLREKFTARKISTEMPASVGQNVPIGKSVAEMSRAELAKECKRRGIKMERTDTKQQLAERLSVQDAA